MLQVTTATGDRAIAERIATTLIDRRLAACVQISGPITSIYHWKDAIETAEEYVCTAKTLAVHFPAIEEVIAELHPYDTPELVGTPLTHASKAYEAWIRKEVGS